MIKEEQLEKWGSAPSSTEMQKIKNTKDLMEKVLKDFLPIEEIKKNHNLSSLSYEVYLQGSYRNSTNIRFDSDVDIVVQVNAVFWSDKSELSKTEIQLHEETYSRSEYEFSELKQEIFTALREYFGEETEYKNKCIKIEGNTSRVDADIIPCFQYRIYKRFVSINNNNFIEGIKFYNTDTNEEVINFPKVHYENGCAKNKDTEGNFKSMVRVFKNFKRELIESGEIDEKLAPSYFIENLLYNCTPHCFNGSFSSCTLQILQFLFDAIKQDRLKSFICANEQDMLFSDKSWDLENAQSFISKSANFYLKD